MEGSTLSTCPSVGHEDVLPVQQRLLVGGTSLHKEYRKNRKIK